MVSTRLLWLTPACLLASAFLFAHGYTGIRHDGIFYLGDALNLIAPERMVGDLYFDAQQGHYTVLPWLYSLLIPLAGFSTGAMGLVLCTYIIYGYAAWRFLCRMVSGPPLTYGLLAVFIAMPVYGGHKVFSYAEPFLTARSVSEPLSLLGLAFLLDGRRLIAAIFLLAAALFHPLITLPALTLAWLYLVCTNRRWLWVLLTAVPFVALAWLDVSPFNGLTQSYDPEWFEVIKEPNIHCFTLQWSIQDWAGLLGDIGLLAMIAATAQLGHVQNLLKASVLLTVVAILATVVFVDGLHNVLLTSLQLWRAQWITHWLSVALMPLLFITLWNTRSNGSRVAALLLVLVLLSAQTLAPPLIIAMAWALHQKQSRIQLGRWVLPLAAIMVAFAALALGFSQFLVLEPLSKHGTLTGVFPTVFALMSITPVTAVVAVFGLSVWQYRAWSTAIVAFGFLILALVGWDQRSDGVRFRESFWGKPLWDNIIAPGSTVYWYGALAQPWLMLQRGNYFSSDQSAPLLFSRPASIKYRDRKNLIVPVESQMQICGLVNALNADDDCTPNAEEFQRLCQMAHIDYMVFPIHLPFPLTASVDAGLLNNNHENKYFLYRCSDIVGVPA